MEQIKQAASNLGRVCMQFQPFDYRRGRFQIAKSGVGLSLPVSRIDRRRPSLHSIGMQSVICAAALVCLFLHVTCYLYMCFLSSY
jgi:hypothetical protein